MLISLVWEMLVGGTMSTACFTLSYYQWLFESPIFKTTVVDYWEPHLFFKTTVVDYWEPHLFFKTTVVDYWDLPWEALQQPTLKIDPIVTITNLNDISNQGSENCCIKSWSNFDRANLLKLKINQHTLSNHASQADYSLVLA